MKKRAMARQEGNGEVLTTNDANYTKKRGGILTTEIRRHGGIGDEPRRHHLGRRPPSPTSAGLQDLKSRPTGLPGFAATPEVA